MPVMVGELLLEAPHPLRSNPQEILSENLHHGQKNAVVTQQFCESRMRLGEGALPHRVSSTRRVTEPLHADRFHSLDEVGYFRRREGLATDDKPEGVELLELIVSQCRIERHQISIRAQWKLLMRSSPA